MADSLERPVLLFGATGQLGMAFQQYWHDAANAFRDYKLMALGRQQIDLTDANAIKQVIQNTRPLFILNAAAYTAVDQAETNPKIAELVNSNAPAAMANAARLADAALIHYSTDYVFDGQAQTPYTELNATRPVSVYGRTKLAGEAAIQAVSSRHLIFRTSWVFGAEGSNFLKTMLRLAAQREALKIVSDQIGAPTSADTLVRCSLQALAECFSSEQHNNIEKKWGLYHLCSKGATSWHGYAHFIIENARAIGFDLKVKSENIAPISTAEFPAAAARPANSCLNCGKFDAQFSLSSRPDWQQSVLEVLHQIKAKSPD
jgi:dTDP-4-dehydrorhamnose reductase